MRQIILGLAVSLDSYIEGPNGAIDWCFTDQDYGMTPFLQQVDAVFMGRKSYEMMQAMGGEASAGFSHLKTYVFSNTLDQAPAGTALVSGDAKAAIEKIKSEQGKNIWLFGGAALASSLLELKLIDEIWLSVHPVILGSGTPLFTGLNSRTTLRLQETRAYDTGLVSLRYAVEK